MADFTKLIDSVVEGNDSGVKENVQALLDAGVAPSNIINEGLIGGMNVVGPRFKAGDIFVPEVIMSAKAMHAGIDVVKSMGSDGEIKTLGTILLGTVKEDLHDIGKNLVGMMLESSGFKVIDIGIDVAPEKFIEAVKHHKPEIVAMSALLTTTMIQLKVTLDEFVKAGVRDQVKIVVGGAPVSHSFANEIGADGYAPDAGSAPELCKKVLLI